MSARKTRFQQKFCDGIVKNFGLLDSLKYKLYDKLIYTKWRDALGGNVIGICTGAAKLNPKLARVLLTAAGILVGEGYGQTESSPVISVTPVEKDMIVFGTVGAIIDGVDVHLDHREGMKDGEGEILCKGPKVMMGYYKRPDLTAETIVDGWWKTGDVGTIVMHKGKKYLKITDRVREIFKTSGGKYTAPLSLESKMKEIPYIEQMLVVGESRNYVSALIVPNFLNLKEWCIMNSIKSLSNKDFVNDTGVHKIFNEKNVQKK